MRRTSSTSKKSVSQKEGWATEGEIWVVEGGGRAELPPSIIRSKKTFAFSRRDKKSGSTQGRSFSACQHWLRGSRHSERRQSSGLLDSQEKLYQFWRSKCRLSRTFNPNLLFYHCRKRWCSWGEPSGLHLMKLLCPILSKFPLSCPFLVLWDCNRGVACKSWNWKSWCSLESPD